jgi:hypothetical protein
VGSESIARPRDTATLAPRYPAVYPFRTPEERRSGQRGRRKPSPCGNAMTRTSDATRVRLLFATPPIAPRLIRRPTLLSHSRALPVPALALSRTRSLSRFPARSSRRRRASSLPPSARELAARSPARAPFLPPSLGLHDLHAPHRRRGRRRRLRQGRSWRDLDLRLCSSSSGSGSGSEPSFLLLGI